MKRGIFSKGFSLIELMIVLSIALVLMTVSIPAYQKYIRRAKNTEAITMLGTFTQAQMATYAIRGHFAHCETTLVEPGALNRWQEGDKVAMDVDCDSGIDFPLGKGAQSHFQYASIPGKYSGAGVLDPEIAENYPTSTTYFYAVGSGAACTSGGVGVSGMSGADIGLETSPPNGYAYYVVYALANLTGGGTDFTSEGRCSLIFQVTEVNPSQGGGFLISPMLVYAFGD